MFPTSQHDTQSTPINTCSDVSTITIAKPAFILQCKLIYLHSPSPPPNRGLSPYCPSQKATPPGDVTPTMHLGALPTAAFRPRSLAFHLFTSSPSLRQTRGKTGGVVLFHSLSLPYRLKKKQPKKEE